MIEFLQGVANFFSTLWDWFNELFKFFDVVEKTYSSCFDILNRIGLSEIVATLVVFLSVLLVSKILCK